MSDESMQGPCWPFEGLQVLELSAGIAAAYCGKMFADAGRRGRESRTGRGRSDAPLASARPIPSDGALFGYLAAGKSSVIGGPASAEVLALDGCRGPGDHRSQCRVDAGRHHRSRIAVRRRHRHHAVRHHRSLRRRRLTGQRVSAAGTLRLHRRPGLARFGAHAGGRTDRRVVRRHVRGRRRRSVGTRGSPDRLRRDHRPVDLRGHGGRHGFVGCGVGQCARRCSDPGPAKRRIAVDRADRRRNGGVLHHHRAAVSGLPGAHRTTRPARRRRSGVDGRSDPASRRVPHHGSRLGGRQDHGRNHRNGNGFPNPRGSDRDAADDHDHRPLRGPSGVRRAPRAEPSRRGSPIAVPRYRPGAPVARRRWAPTTDGWPGDPAGSSPRRRPKRPRPCR